ncbi:maleylpyruvate isomerase N-terminal domain-containing protein [Saccharothrix deserti]|uniref:maleylpyruvate isomerase N-terminal domain-containing protein n=1 Tax=Saccharothrix deserti TaxID=2593674 RepID=UPI00131B45C2|nr:maleylpyruvate isomerase N-terminal domain-containing protein [Saccharothrix deserti]
MGFDRYRTEIVTRTELLVSPVDGAAPMTPVPTCPDWTSGRLLRHVGEGHLKPDQRLDSEQGPEKPAAEVTEALEQVRRER